MSVPQSMSTSPVLLTLENVHVSYGSGSRRVDAVRGVSFELRQGETLGIVGESGSGKSTLAYAIMGHLGQSGAVRDGEIRFKGEDIRRASEARLRELRGNRISMVYQDPNSSLTPSIPIGEQVGEVLSTHLGLAGEARRRRIVELLSMVNLPDPDSVLDRYPHQLSGGQKQRVLIAMALACDPDLLIMDEPTTALDVTTEATILDLINELKERVNAAILYISHNLGVIARVSNRVVVMYAGEVVETASVGELFDNQRHPYTLGLLGCVPRLGLSKTHAPLRPIPGRIPSPLELPPGCVFAPRCPYVQDRCREERPELFTVNEGHLSRCFFWQEVDRTASRFRTQVVAQTEVAARANGSRPLVEVRDLKKYFTTEGSGFSLLRRNERTVKAVDGVEFDVQPGETLALVGESGCGKTTISRCLAGLLLPSSGEMMFEGESINQPAEKRPRGIRSQLQMVFQNPESSLNPRRTVGAALERPLELLTRMNKQERRERVLELLEMVNLDSSYAERYPTQLSGGEKQRVAIARAFASGSKMIICDEPVSSLDVSVQAAILNLFTRLQNELGTSYLFVSHDLGVVRYLSDRIAVIYLGHIVEIGTVDEIFSPPYHPYTESLLSAIPIPDPNVAQKAIRLEGPVPSPANPPSGCPFHTRCPRKIGAICEREVPPIQDAGNGHQIWCHIPVEKLRLVSPVVETRSEPADVGD
jgi:peptide/nickel transport system ATP-binding protein